MNARDEGGKTLARLSWESMKKAWSLPFPKVEAAWVIEDGECSGMRGLETGESFPITPQRFEVAKGNWDVMDETPPLLSDSPRFRVIRETLPLAS